MSYKIVSFDEKTGQIDVTCDGGIKFSLEIPIEDGKYIEGTLLDEYINKFIPVSIIERNDTIKNGIENSDTIKSLVVGEDVIGTDYDIKAGQIRQRRNNRLSATDWTQLPDAPLTQEQKAIYFTYRQQLRDVTKQDGFPFDVICPEEPRI